MNPQSKVSYHCIISRDGKRTILADDAARCWHAGISSWDGVPDCNSYSMGIAWEGDTYLFPLGEAAIESALQYVVPRIKKWRIPVERVVTHQQIAPLRKNDIAWREAEKFRRRLKEALN